MGLSENELCVVIEEHVLENHGVVEPGARERVVHGDVDIVVGERELGEGKYGLRRHGENAEPRAAGTDGVRWSEGPEDMGR